MIGHDVRQDLAVCHTYAPLAFGLRRVPLRARGKPAVHRGCSNEEPAIAREEVNEMAATKTKPAAKPAAEKPAVKQGVGIKELASDLNRDQKSVRASIRRLKGGAQVGQGGRYSWKSKTDPEYVSLRKELSAPKVSKTDS